MTPPNELEKLAEFQDAIQSNKGLERLRAMQYLQQMNNQGIMGLPQVQQQPIVQRENGGVTMPEPYYDLDTALKNTEVGEYFVLGQGVNQKLYKVGVGNNGEKIPTSEPVTDELKEKLFNVENSPDYTTAPTYSGETTPLVGGRDAYTAEDIKDGTVTEEKAIAYRNYLRDLEQSNQDRSQYNRRKIAEQYGDMGMQFRAYGGEVGTGGLVGLTADGMQIFDNSQEGALNRATHGGVLEGYNYTPSTGGTSTATSTSTPSVTTNSLDAPGTLASGTTAPSGFAIEGGQDKYGNTIGDTTGSKDYYDLNYAAQAAGQDTFMYGDKLMQVDGGYLRGYPFNPFISNKVPEDVIANPHLYTSTGETTHNLTSLQRRPDVTNPGFYSETPYLPTGDFTQDVSGSYDSYYDANKAASEASSPTFMYGDKLAKTDPGLLPNYQGGMKPFISNAIPEKWISAGVHLPPGWSNMSAQTLARAQPGYKRPASEGGHYLGSGVYENSGGGQITAREGGGQVDPSQAAEGLASFGRYGDNILVHMNPEELSGLASLGNITYNPVTGLPEAFSFKSIFKGIRKLAPVILAVAMPHLMGVAGGSALAVGGSTAFGSFLGNMIAGAKPKDALKSGLLSGLFAGGGAYMGGAPSGFGGGFGGVTNAANAASTAGAGLSKAGGAMYGSTAGVAPSAGTSALRAGISGPGLSGTSQAMYGSTPTFGPPSQFTPSMGDISSSLAQGKPPLQLANPNIGNPMVPRIGQNVNVGGQSFANASEFNPYQNVVQGDTQQLADPRIMEMGAIDPPAPTGSEFTSSSPDLYSPESLSKMNAIDPPGESISVFKPDGMTKENLKLMGGEIYDQYANPTGIAKLVGMDMSTPDWEAQYAAEAAAKKQQLTDAGYTVETGFDGQTVIRDSSGVVMPRNLTVQDILDRALGKQKRTNLVERYDYAPKESKEGGLVSLKHGGEFSGMVPGQGHGMEDNVYMPIVEKGHGSQVGTLAVSPSEYVVDSYTMAALGNGNADAGAKVMDNVVKGVRKKAYGNMKQPNEINGLSALQPMMERANI